MKKVVKKIVQCFFSKKKEIKFGNPFEEIKNIENKLLNAQIAAWHFGLPGLSTLKAP